MKKIEKQYTVAGKDVKISFGHIGFRSDVCLMVQQGETVVMVFVNVDAKDSDLDYFPLNINYVEKDYAGGIISGSRFVKREGRPSDEAIIKGRVIDRAMRPLFPDNFRRGVCVVINVMAYDGENDPALLAANASSIAMHMSSVPFGGPVASVRVGSDGENLLVNPTVIQMQTSKLDAVVSASASAVTQLEIDGQQIEESKMAETLKLGFDSAQEWNKIADELKSEFGKEKIVVGEEKENVEVKEKVKTGYYEKLNEALLDDENRNKRLDALYVEMVNELKTEEISESEIKSSAHKIEKEIVRGMLLSGNRPSGRKIDEIREIEVIAPFLPRVHGSAMFRRGVSQAISITTLGSTRLYQTNENFEGESLKRYMHHYMGPNYSVGEAGRFNFYPGNREIGHGALAEKALVPVLPSEEEFPYAIRVVSEIISQNGSTSMAATCGSCLALMDAGVPLKAPVAGISIGLITRDLEQTDFQLLTDVQDVEDYYGDMDFKVTGSEKGITAIQMDTKLKGVKVEILQAALTRAREGRMHILSKYKKVLPAPRAVLSPYAPKVLSLRIKVEQIGDLIGPAGKVIKGILESVDNKADVDIKEDGQVIVTAIDQAVIDQVVEQIKGITMELEIGKIYSGRITRIEAYGLFVEITPKITGLVHVSEVSDTFVKDVNQLFKLGQQIDVKVLAKDADGKIKLSVKQVKKAE